MPDAALDRSMKQFRLPHGLRVWSAPESRLETRFIYNENFERHLYERHGVAVTDGNVIFDVGANIGLFTLSLMERFYRLRIYCFEPVPPTFTCLTRNIEGAPARAAHQIATFNLALGAREADTSIEYFPRMPGNSSLHAGEKQQEFHAILSQSHLSDLWRVNKRSALFMAPLYPFRRWIFGAQVDRMLASHELIACHVRTLSSVIREQGVDRIDLLKIDVEGAELEVLDGIEEQHWPLIRQLAMEIGPANKRHLGALEERLHALGFDRVTAEGMLGGKANPADPMPASLYAVRDSLKAPGDLHPVVPATEH